MFVFYCLPSPSHLNSKELGFCLVIERAWCLAVCDRSVQGYSLLPLGLCTSFPPCQKHSFITSLLSPSRSSVSVSVFLDSPCKVRGPPWAPSHLHTCQHTSDSIQLGCNGLRHLSSTPAPYVLGGKNQACLCLSHVLVFYGYCNKFQKLRDLKPRFYYFTVL